MGGQPSGLYPCLLYTSGAKRHISIRRTICHICSRSLIPYIRRYSRILHISRQRTICHISSRSLIPYIRRCSRILHISRQRTICISVAGV